MPARENRGQDPIHHFLLPNDPSCDLSTETAHGGGESLELLDVGTGSLGYGHQITERR